MPTTLVVKTPAKNAETVRRITAGAGALRGEFVPKRERGYVFFPVTKKIELSVPHSFVRAKLEARVKPKDFGKSLAGFLSGKELAAAVKGFDVVGSIAVIQVPPALAGKAKRIARALLAAHSRVKTVLQKTGGREGAFRVQRVRWLAGAKSFVALHRENECVFRVDLREAYYSPRLSNERARVASLVKSNENVLVPFAGVGPFAILIAKKQPSAEVVAIELNPAGAKLLAENVVLNRVSERVRAVKGDALKLLASLEFRGWADRIVMPLPHSAKSFLPAALKALKKGGAVHYYRIVRKAGAKETIEKEARAACAAAKPKRKFKVLGFRRVVLFSPSKAEYVLDFKVF